MVEQRLYRAEELLTREFADGRHELWDGALVVHDYSELWSEAVAAVVITALRTHVAERRLGIVTGSSAGFVVARDPDRVLVPDCAFVRRERVVGTDLRRLGEGAPDLVVEVRSHTDRWADVLEKSGIWIAHGARLVWAVEPNERVVEVFEPGKPSRELRTGDVLSGAPVLPALQIAVADLFPDVD